MVLNVAVAVVVDLVLHVVAICIFGVYVPDVAVAGCEADEEDDTVLGRPAR